MITDLPEHIQSTFRNLDLTDADADRFMILTNKIHKYLKSKKIKYELDFDTFVDCEYPDWMELKLIITIPEKDFEITYNDIKQDIYNLVEKNAGSKLMDLILIKIKTFN